jgi:hypothetical protein
MQAPQPLLTKELPQAKQFAEDLYLTLRGKVVRGDQGERSASISMRS